MGRKRTSLPGGSAAVHALRRSLDAVAGDPALVAAAVLDHLADALHADTGAAWSFVAPNRMECISAIGAAGEERFGTRTLGGPRIAALRRELHHPQTAADDFPAAFDQLGRELLPRRAHAGASLLLTLHAPVAPVGVLGLGRAATAPWSPEDRRLARTLAETAAAALPSDAVPLAGHRTATPHRDTSETTVSSASPQRRAILVVDDEPLIREVVEVILTSRGCRVLTAADAAAAEQICRAEAAALDCVLLDVNLPDAPCHEVVARLRGIRDDLKIVLSSGGDLPVELGDCRDAGVHSFLSKPFTSDRLVAALAPDSADCR